jgi:hypothetical protein
MLPTLRDPRAAARRFLLVLVATLGLTATTLAVSAPAHAVILPTNTVVAGPVGALAGQSVTLTADVTFPLIGGLIVSPSGKVTFTASNGGAPVTLGSKTLGVAGCILNLPFLPPCRVTLTTNALPPGNVTVTAKYSGDLLARTSTGTTTMKVLATPGAPFAPTLVGTNQVGSVKFKWLSGFDGGSPILSYSLYRSTSPAGPFSKVADVLPTGDYQETTLPVGVNHYYKATAVNAFGESAFSNQTTNQATAFGGPSTYTSEECPAFETCYSETVSATEDGSTTKVSLNTSESANPHTLTAAIGGPNLVACANRYSGFSATFHDTSVDAYKNVELRLVGPDAQNMFDNSGFPAARIGCLGLGTPWKDGPGGGDFADWSPADGLYVGTPAYCSEMGAFEVNPNQYSQPCVEASFYLNPDVIPNEPNFEMTFRLAPGDGKISGGR